VRGPRTPAATSVSALDLDFAILDFETTGLSPRRAEVVETGAVRCRVGGARETFHALSRPSAPIPPGAVAVHGITDDMVAERPPFADVLPELREFLEGRVLVAHHARFDLGFLAAATRRAGWPRPPHDVWCTVRLSRRFFPALARHDLDSLCVTHGIRRGAAHRALDDACATADLLAILVERAQELRLPLEELACLARPPRPAAPAPPRAWTDEERSLLEEAITTGDRVILDYVSRRGIRTSRQVVPYAVGEQGSGTRLVAYDLAAGRTRTFRLDRVVSLRAFGGSCGA
jgi:DNA polymerase-3 subunit epsilon